MSSAVHLHKSEENLFKGLIERNLPPSLQWRSQPFKWSFDREGKLIIVAGTPYGKFLIYLTDMKLPKPISTILSAHIRRLTMPAFWPRAAQVRAHSITVYLPTTQATLQ